MTLILGFLLGYVFGSIPFGLLLTKAAGLGDVRAIGSGNIGATNVLRTGSKPIAALTLLLDMAKGLLPVVIAARLWNGDAAVLAGLGALIGHILPIWLRFKGGKGVATYIGLVAGLYWPLAVLFGLLWVAVAAIWRISSAAALTASAAVAAAAVAIAPSRIAIALCISAAIIFITHRAKIGRLVRKQEPTISFSKKA